MVSFTTALLAAAAAMGALALPPLGPERRASADIEPRNTPNGQGTDGGYFWQFWSEGGGSVTYTNKGGGEYSVVWSNVGDFTAGKGWQTATNRTIKYSGSFSPGSNSYLAIYTWSGSGETYILENFGQYNPGSPGQHIGTLSSDGGTYDVYKVERSATYIQYWSIRQSKRSSGTVTTANHYNWYNQHGLPFNPATNATYQILSTEGYGSTGNSDMTISEVNSTSSK